MENHDQARHINKDEEPKKAWSRPTVETVIAVKKTKGGPLQPQPEDSVYRPS
ncbi:MAG: hypothetical protein K0U68_03345 [Gammaproteobacteria bacterium]|nr:hypothetical protein [Gammaproteobacteria bacterium]